MGLLCAIVKLNMLMEVREQAASSDGWREPPTSFVARLSCNETSSVTRSPYCNGSQAETGRLTISMSTLPEASQRSKSQ
jgi:hypothetical protein